MLELEEAARGVLVVLDSDGGSKGTGKAKGKASKFLTLMIALIRVCTPSPP